MHVDFSQWWWWGTKQDNAKTEIILWYQWHDMLAFRPLRAVGVVGGSCFHWCGCEMRQAVWFVNLWHVYFQAWYAYLQAISILIVNRATMWVWEARSFHWCICVFYISSGDTRADMPHFCWHCIHHHVAIMLSELLYYFRFVVLAAILWLTRFVPLGLMKR